LPKTIRSLGTVLFFMGFAFGFAVAPAAAGAANPAAKYHSYAELSAEVKTLVDAHKDIARLESIGKTGQGRDIWIVTLAGRGGLQAKDRPGLFIGANLEADHLIGSEIALSVIADLLKGYPSDPDIKQRLDSTVFYIAPRLNPDGAEGMFAQVQAFRRGNLSPRDDDNDGRVDEDGPQDLNKDGLITAMRVKDPRGEYMTDPDEPRLVRKADPKKGETGAYKLYWEGADKDKDGFIAEDGPGGTDLNRNFAHDYPFYAADAGPHMISEPETRALMDWILAHRNVAAILTFGESDDLIVTPTANRPPGREIDLVRFAAASNAEASKQGIIESRPFGFGRFGGMMFEFMDFSAIQRMMGGPGAGAPAGGQPQGGSRFRMPDRKPVMSLNPDDLEYFKTVSGKYGEITGIKTPPVVRDPHGAFFQYGYYQFGVPSFSTPGWGLPGAPPAGPPGMGPGARGPQGAPTGAPAGAAPAGAPAPGQQVTVTSSSGPGGEIMQMIRMGGPGGGAGGPDAGGPAAPPAAGIDKTLLKWLDAEKIDGFVPWTKFRHPDLGDVEIGGFKPYAIDNPPAARVAELGPVHAKFALYLASLFPRVRIASTEVAAQGGGFYRIKAEVENAGYFPTALAQAVTARSVSPTLIQLEVKPEDIIFGNPKTNFLPTLAGSGNRAKYEWVIKGSPGATVELKVVSQKGGSDKAAITLR
jgi:hypothetical protein